MAPRKTPVKRPASDTRLPKVTLLERLDPPSGRQDIGELRDRLDHLEPFIRDAKIAATEVKSRLGWLESETARLDAANKARAETAAVSPDHLDMIWPHLLFWFVVNDALVAGVYAYWRAFGFHLPQV